MGSISNIEVSRRQVLLSLLMAGASATLPAHAAQLSRRPGQLPPGQYIFKLFGDVRINGIAVTLETKLKAGDVLTTGARSFVIFAFEQDAFILRSNSEMTVRPSVQQLSQDQSSQDQSSQDQPAKDLEDQQNVKSAPGSTSLIPAAYSLRRGKALSVMASRRTSISTPSAVISIRGTGVYVEAEPDEAYVCVCYGATEIQSAVDASVKETVITKQHDAPKYVTSGSNPQITPAPFKNHDDEELLLIETLVGRTTPYIVPRNAPRSRRSYY